MNSATSDGHECVLAVRGAGDLVRESAVLGSQDRAATVTALTAVRGLVVPAARLTAYLDAHPATWCWSPARSCSGWTTRTGGCRRTLHMPKLHPCRSGQAAGKGSARSSTPHFVSMSAPGRLAGTPRAWPPSFSSGGSRHPRPSAGGEPNR
ncbi:cyclic nucleotide-binding domain-containing protein [Actinomadura sp. NPDC023710]|uniref:cyclic nucleotide-binding domain-containing protein n=1 Tax=Actinomadura sp. NPDC023710 TaxID=3158219 RepID=UPI0033E10663